MQNVSRYAHATGGLLAYILEGLDTGRLLPCKEPPMRGHPMTSHDVGQEEGESLEAGEVGRTT